MLRRIGVGLYGSGRCQVWAFCTELTSIKQDQVDDAPAFAEVVESLRQWADWYAGYLFCSWGDYDRNQLNHECRRNGIAYPLTEDHLNLKKRFSQRLGTDKRFGMAAMQLALGPCALNMPAM